MVWSHIAFTARREWDLCRVASRAIATGCLYQLRRSTRCAPSAIAATVPPAPQGSDSVSARHAQVLRDCPLAFRHVRGLVDYFAL